MSKEIANLGIVLSQKGSSVVLRVEEILALEASHDLVLLKMKEKVSNYLSIKEGLLKPSENLFVLGYPGGVFKKMRKTGNIFYENIHSYNFPVDYFDVSGASGSPVLDEQGQVVGVLFGCDENLLEVLKINHLKNFIAGHRKQNCSNLIDVKKLYQERNRAS